MPSPPRLPRNHRLTAESEMLKRRACLQRNWPGQEPCWMPRPPRQPHNVSPFSPRIAARRLGSRDHDKLGSAMTAPGQEQSEPVDCTREPFK
jgi:hypothetical protein